MKIFNFNREKHYLNAEEAQNILKFGYKHITIEDALSKEIDDLETMIRSKSEVGNRILVYSYPDYKMDLVEKLVEHFKENGFVVDIYKNPKIESFVVLIIGW